MKEDTFTRTEADAAHAANALGRDEWIGTGITAYDCEPNELLDEPDARLRDDPWEPFTCLRCNHLERYATDRCTECHMPKGDDYR